jgi:hypothetical protein
MSTPATLRAASTASPRRSPSRRERGRLTLRYPQWLPGNHAPRGPIAELVGVANSARRRQPLHWERDRIDVNAFHLDLPAGARGGRPLRPHLAAAAAEGRVTMTPEMLNLQWEKMSLYPAGTTCGA